MDWLTAGKPLIIGHRGASADAPENTLAAFALAAEQGADGIELDVQLSGDGRLIIIHDFDVSRTTDGQGQVSSLTVETLQSFDAGQGQTMPTLDEVFETLGPRLLYNIEIKYFGWRSNGIEAAVADRIESHHLENRVLVSSFNPLAVRRAQRQLSRTVPTALIRGQGFLKYGYLLADGAADHPHYSLVDEAYMAWAKKRGYRVNVWTVDDLVEARRLVNLGVHGLITNKPEALRESLNL
ncbi:MAG: glycerophosphodiester phosphodiesterase [Chloroflexi bacterium]|nr:glycerophosphodiester phosphodiesterase [Chloroflexota bacterium]